MKNQKRLFIICAVIGLTILTFGIFSSLMLNDGITRTYHPNAAAGYYGSRYSWAFQLGLLLNWLAITFIATYDKTESKLKKLLACGVILLLLIGGFYTVRRIPTNNHVTYYIDDEAYSIPWQYNPMGGSAVPGDDGFRVHVSYPDFDPQYLAEEYYKLELILEKRLFNQEEEHTNEISLDILCIADACEGLTSESPTYFVDDSFVYKIENRGEPVRFRDATELAVFKQKVVKVFDSFKVQ